MSPIRRRDVFLYAAATGAAAMLGRAAAAASDSPELTARRDKRRPQYRPDSAEVQTFYRVNRYPAKR